MDPSLFPFDIEAYKRQSEFEERFIVNRFFGRDASKKTRKNCKRDTALHNSVPHTNTFSCSTATMAATNAATSITPTEANNSIVVYGYNDDPQNPEETETILGHSPAVPTKRYKGVWRKKSGKWAARTRDPNTNIRVFIGTYNSAEQARLAYFSRKLQFEARVRAYNDLSSSVVIDNHGYLFGEFSSLDDEMRIHD